MQSELVHRDVLRNTVRIHARGGAVNGVVIIPSIHIQDSAAPTQTFDGNSVLIDVCTDSREQTLAPGIELLDAITVPKTITELAGMRIAARSIDDRFGCAALLALTQRIDPDSLAGRSLMSLTQRYDLKLNYGATGGGNDGSVLRSAKSSVVPLGIPLRYSHSAIETIDTPDLEGLVDLLKAMVLDSSWID
ncbi:MAG: hypothetical protein PVF50_03380 [Gammaproteobacteria bacterium]